MVVIPTRLRRLRTPLAVLGAVIFLGSLAIRAADWYQNVRFILEQLNSVVGFLETGWGLATTTVLGLALILAALLRPEPQAAQVAVLPSDTLGSAGRGPTVEAVARRLTRLLDEHGEPAYEIARDTLATTQMLLVIPLREPLHPAARLLRRAVIDPAKRTLAEARSALRESDNPEQIQEAVGRFVRQYEVMRDTMGQQWRGGALPGAERVAEFAEADRRFQQALGEIIADRDFAVLRLTIRGDDGYASSWTNRTVAPAPAPQLVASVAATLSPETSVGAGGVDIRVPPRPNQARGLDEEWIHLEAEPFAWHPRAQNAQIQASIAGRPGYALVWAGDAGRPHTNVRHLEHGEVVLIPLVYRHTGVDRVPEPFQIIARKGICYITDAAFAPRLLPPEELRPDTYEVEIRVRHDETTSVRSFRLTVTKPGEGPITVERIEEKRVNEVTAPTRGVRAYRVRVGPGHPTGNYGRGGQRFTREPRVIRTSDLSNADLEAILKDDWLIKEPYEEPQT